MRKQDKILLWPAYFDSNKTRLEGRRVSKSLGITSPKLVEIQNAARSIGLQPEVVLDVKYPKSPWQKTGYILIPKRDSKAKTIRRIARELVNVRK
ncbi:MAG: signal recognition particle subunit SRP19/SEC65 family protein [Candidatus Bathyarchaeota archaeon]|jgi:signal recognition particle subunit SRP19